MGGIFRIPFAILMIRSFVHSIQAGAQCMSVPVEVGLDVPEEVERELACLSTAVELLVFRSRQLLNKGHLPQRGDLRISG